MGKVKEGNKQKNYKDDVEGKKDVGEEKDREKLKKVRKRR